MPPEPVLKFRGSLKELMQTVRQRVTHATELIDASDEPEIIDREMRYIRPFWEFFAARQKLNQLRFWESCAKKLKVRCDNLLIRKTPLVWLPGRQFVAEATGNMDDAKRAALLTILRGIDIALFNFNTLMARCRFILGIEDPESFQIVTQEKDDIGSYRLMRSTFKREGADGVEYKIITCRFIMPDGEEIKIEKDYSVSRTDPLLHIRLLKAGPAVTREDLKLEFDGGQSQLNQRFGRLRTSRL